MNSKLAVKFRIRGNLRFLSHQETVRVLQRALIRAGIEVLYSHGYNPRPQISLPLPRAVGVQSDDELLCVCIGNGSVADSGVGQSEQGADAVQLKNRLQQQLPEGCEIISAEIVSKDTNFYPVAARYVFRLGQQTVLEQVRAVAGQVLNSEKLLVQRRIDEAGNTRTVDVRSFIRTIDFDGLDVEVTAVILSSGTIRVDEMMKSLGIEESMLAEPVRRRCVEWRKYAS